MSSFTDFLFQTGYLSCFLPKPSYPFTALSRSRQIYLSSDQLKKIQSRDKTLYLSRKIFHLGSLWIKLSFEWKVQTLLAGTRQTYEIWFGIDKEKRKFSNKWCVTVRQLDEKEIFYVQLNNNLRIFVFSSSIFNMYNCTYIEAIYINLNQPWKKSLRNVINGGSAEGKRL